MITTLVICVEWCHSIQQKNRYRRYPCPTVSVFDKWLSVFVFVFEDIRILI